MSTATKHVLKIFVSHQDLNKFPTIRDACRILDEEKNRINNEGRQKDLIEVRFVDYQYWRNLANPSNSTYQSADSLKDDASNAHAVFTLVDGDISPRIRKWYNVQIRRVRKEKEERRIHMPIFWDTSTSVSADNCEAFYQKNDSDFVFRYNSMDELRGLLASELKQLTDRWATTISRQQTVPTLASNLLRRRIKWLISGIIFAILCFSIYMLWPRIHGFCIKDTRDDPVTVVEVPQTKGLEAGEQDIISATSDSTTSSTGLKPSKRGEGKSMSYKSNESGVGSYSASVEIPWTNEQKNENRLVFISIRAKTLTGDYTPLKGRIKNKLSEAGLKVTDDKNHALWTITMDCAARKHDENAGFFTAFVDVDMDIINTVTEDTIHSGSVNMPGSSRDGIKGVSTISYEKAVETAYQNMYSLLDQYLVQIK